MSIDTQKIRSQLYMIERATRALRIHIEEQQEVPGQTGWGAIKAPLETGLGKLLATSNDIQPFTPKSHERFFPGVWFGYVADNEDFNMEIRTRCHPAVDHGQLLEDSGSSALVVTVGCQAEADDLWLTLETALDSGAVLAGEGFEVRFILGFINSAPYPLGDVGLQLGMTREDGYSPQFRRTYPALDVPLELSYSLTADQLQSLPSEGIQSLNLILTLPVPVKGRYTAVLSYFETTLARRVSM
jgi:hypothetical protein